jgi:hypothetical protein
VTTVPTEWELLRTDDRVDALSDATTGADLIVVGTAPHSRLYTLLFGDVSTRIGDRVDGSLLLVYPNESGTGTFLRKAIERVAFGTSGTGATAPED